MGSRPAVIPPGSRIAQFRFGQDFTCFLNRRVSSFAGIRDPDKAMAFIPRDNTSAVVKHHVEGSGVIQVDPQVDFFLRNYSMSNLKSELQTGGSIPFSPLFFPDTVTDMPRAIPKRFRQVMTYPELPDQAIIIPQTPSR